MSTGAGKVARFQDAQVRGALADARKQASQWQRRAEAAETALAAAYSNLAGNPTPPPREFIRAYEELTHTGKRFVAVMVGNGTGVVLDRSAIRGRSAAEVWDELRTLVS